MNILVCISHVPDTTTKISFQDNQTKFNSNGVQFIINPYDEIALSKAIELAGDGKGTVTVITVGDASTEATIRKALAIGADKAIRVNAEPRDALFVATQIAEFVKHTPQDIIFTGRESIDYNGAQVAGYLGEILNITSVSVAKGVRLSGDEILVDREIEGGKEVLTTKMPAVIGTAEGVAEPKIANMRGIMSARTKPLEVLEPIEVAEYSKIERFESPEPRGAVTLVDDVDQLVQLLHNKAKVI